MDNRKPKILLLDIETTHMILAGFSLYEDNGLSHENILRDWFIPCVAWKWLDEDKVHVVKMKSLPKTLEEEPDDLEVVKTIYDVLMQADVVIAHNLKKFDMKKINTRAIYHGLDPLPKIASIDTLEVAKKHFKFSSNRLDYLGNFLGVGRKIKTTKGLWLEILQGNNKALKEMAEYNKGDVSLLQDVYLKLLPWIQNHPNLNMFKDPAKEGCPNCESTNLQRRGYARTNTSQFQRYQCNSCGAWSQGRKNIKKGLEIR